MLTGWGDGVWGYLEIAHQIARYLAANIVPFSLTRCFSLEVLLRAVRWKICPRTETKCPNSARGACPTKITCDEMLQVMLWSRFNGGVREFQSSSIQIFVHSNNVHFVGSRQDRTETFRLPRRSGHFRWPSPPAGCGTPGKTRIAMRKASPIACLTGRFISHKVTILPGMYFLDNAVNSISWTGFSQKREGTSHEFDLRWYKLGDTGGGVVTEFICPRATITLSPAFKRTLTGLNIEMLCVQTSSSLSTSALNPVYWAFHQHDPDDRHSWFSISAPFIFWCYHYSTSFGLLVPFSSVLNLDTYGLSPLRAWCEFSFLFAMIRENFFPIPNLRNPRSLILIFYTCAERNSSHRSDRSFADDFHLSSKTTRIHTFPGW
jgi:hypothetical protein